MDNPGEEEVHLRTHSGAPPRLRVSADDLAPKRVLGSSVLLDGTLTPVPTAGLQIPGDRRPEVRSVQICPTPDGDELLVPADGLPLMLNGVRAMPGSKTLLRRGDTVAYAGSVAHYLPDGQDNHELARIQAVQAGRISMDRGEFVIGRARQVDLRLDHPTVLLRHAVVRSSEAGSEIRAVGPSSSLRVNGIPVSRTDLVDGDEIAIGPYRIVFGGANLYERLTGIGLAITGAGLTVRYGVATVLHPTDVAIGSGEMVALIGESGAGKSTLLNVLAGVAPASGGTVVVGGEPVTNRLTEIGYVPQFDIVHGKLTAREALDYAARLRLPQDTSDAERAARIEQVLGELGLGERADLQIDKLSGGQRKRVAVGVELLHRPGALFLDEPTTGLDPGLERQLMRLLRAIADRGQTVVFVTHATSSIALCDRVIVMGRGGRMRFSGAPDELLESFGINSFDDVYLDATDVDAPVPRRRRLRFEDSVEGTRDAMQVPQRRAQVQQSFLHQTKTLSIRYMKLMSRDRAHLRSAMLQVPVLGVLTALLFSRSVFEHDPAPLAAKSAQLIFLMTMIASWLGSVGAAREIVKERSVLARELAAGLRLESYLTSKVLVLAALVTAQVVVFSAIVLLLRPLHESAVVLLALLTILIVTGLVAILLGLVVSASAKSEDQATGVIPLMLVPQLLLSGAIVAVADMTIVMKAASLLIPAHWSFAAAGHVVGMEERIESDTVFREVSRYGQSFFDTTLPQFIFVSVLFALAFLSATAWLLRDGRGK